MVIVRRLLCIALLLCVGIGLGAQGQSRLERRILLQVTQAPETGLSADELLVVSRSFLMVLQDAAGRDVRVEETAAPVGTDDTLTALAAEKGDDAWIWIVVSVENSGTRVHARSYDLFYKAAGFDISLTRPGRISALDLPYEKWEEIARAVSSGFGSNAVAAQVRAEAGSSTITVIGKPGTRVTGTAGVDVSIGTEGSAQLVLPTPSEYTLRAVLSGYRSVITSLFLTENRVVTLPLVPVPVWGLEAGIFGPGIPSVELSWGFLPDTDFLRAGFDLYSLGLAFDSDGIFYSRPLTEIDLQVGHIIGDEDWLVRYTVGFGGFLRVGNTTSFPWIDPSSPGGISLLLGADLRVSPTQRFFLEYTPRFYSIWDATAFKAFYTRPNNDSPDWFGWVYGNGVASQLLVFRVGFRWLL